jgi:hypothetical protein
MLAHDTLSQVRSTVNWFTKAGACEGTREKKKKRGAAKPGGGALGVTWPPRAHWRRSRSQSGLRRSVPGSSGMAARLHSHDRNLAACHRDTKTRSAPRSSGNESSGRRGGAVRSEQVPRQDSASVACAAQSSRPPPERGFYSKSRTGVWGDRRHRRSSAGHRPRSMIVAKQMLRTHSNE